MREERNFREKPDKADKVSLQSHREESEGDKKQFPVLTWQRGFRVRSTAVVASTSLPSLHDRRVGVKRGQNPKHWGGGGCFQTLG